MSKNHADIEVGTGYCLNQCRYQPGEVRIALIDFQKNCLDFTSKRLRRYKPESYLCNATEPLQLGTSGFDSVALGGILHCIPGSMNEKAAIFDSSKEILNAEGCIFGYTILNQGIKKTLLSRIVYLILQKLKVINGLTDSAQELSIELNKRYQSFQVEVVGSIAIFVAQSPIKK